MVFTRALVIDGATKQARLISDDKKAFVCFKKQKKSQFSWSLTEISFATVCLTKIAEHLLDKKEEKQTHESRAELYAWVGTRKWI